MTIQSNISLLDKIDAEYRHVYEQACYVSHIFRNHLNDIYLKITDENYIDSITNIRILTEHKIIVSISSKIETINRNYNNILDEIGQSSPALRTIIQLAFGAAFIVVGIGAKIKLLSILLVIIGVLLVADGLPRLYKLFINSSI